MQRVSAFLPSWEKRNSAANANTNTTGTNTNTSSTSRPGGLFGWSHRATSSNASNASNAAIKNGSARTSGIVNGVANGALAKINVAAANSNGRVQREAYWPATLELECDKAARILKSFCTDGYLAPIDSESRPLSSQAEPQTPAKITKKIPKRVIQNAAGIAIFTCMRNGLWMTGSGGSGILIARKSDGTWSPPSGIMLHTPTLSFIIGVDVYDCVLVVNNLAALESITRPRVTLGEDVGLSSGPSVPLDSEELDFDWKDLGNTVLTYMKSRGQHQNVNLNGCILTERTNENERFYSGNVTQMDILAGNVARHVNETRPLFEVIKMAEGRTDYDRAIVDTTTVQPAPGDAMIATPKSSTASPRPSFGILKADDPDPFGILALEMAGLEIREAGSQLRPASSQFDSSQNPMSPSVSKFNRQSVDTFVTKSNRGSYMSSRTVRSQGTDACTQTDTGNTPETTPSPSRSDDENERGSIEQIPEANEDEDEVDYTAVDLTPLRHLSQEHSVDMSSLNEAVAAQSRGSKMLAPASTGIDMKRASKGSSNYENEDEDEEQDTIKTDDEDDEEEDEDEDEEEDAVVFEVAAVQPARTQVVTSRMIHARGNVVTIPKRIPPPLPKRSPARNSRSSKSEMGADVTTARSPLRQAFSEADLRTEEDKSQAQEPEQSVDAKSDGDEAEKTLPAELTVAEPEVQKPKMETPVIHEPNSDEIALVEPTVQESVDQEAEVEAKIPTADRPSMEADALVTEQQDGNAERVDSEAQGHNEASMIEETEVKTSDHTPATLQRDSLQSSEEEVRRKEPEEERIGADASIEQVDTVQDESTIQGPKAEVEEGENSEAHLVDDVNQDKLQEEESVLDSSHLDQADSSDSVSKKHTSSIYTGATEDRWSFDGSSLTTPTSRPHSMAEDTAGEGTPKKPGKEMGTEESDETPSPQNESKTAAPSTATVV